MSHSIFRNRWRFHGRKQHKKIKQRHWRTHPLGKGILSLLRIPSMKKKYLIIQENKWEKLAHAAAVNLYRLQSNLPDIPLVVVVIMGVSGSGKSTVGDMLAKTMECTFLDADDFHPQANKEKMSKGIPLTEEDRIPWLQTLSNVLRDNLLNYKAVVLGCSALQKSYREILRKADTNYKSGSYVSKVKFVCLNASAEVLAARLEKRAKEGSHFMPATLLQSQIDLLQIDDDEGIFMVDATLSPQILVNSIKDTLSQQSGKELNL